METLKMNIRGKEEEIILPVNRLTGTMYVGSDRYFVVCNTVLSNKKCGIVVLYDIDENNYKNYIEVGSDGLEYLKADAYNKMVPNNETRYYSLRKNGVWYPVGQEMRPGCSGVNFGYGRPYLDPSF